MCTFGAVCVIIIVERLKNYKINLKEVLIMKQVTLEKTDALQKDVFINGKKSGHYEMLGNVIDYMPDKSEIHSLGGILFNSKAEMIKSLSWEMEDFKIE